MLELEFQALERRLRVGKAQNTKPSIEKSNVIPMNKNTTCK